MPVKTLQRLIVHYLLHYWRQASVTYACMTLTTIAGLIVPQIIRRVIDEGLSGGSSSLVVRAAMIILGLSAASAFFSFGQRYMHSWRSTWLTICATTCMTTCSA